MVVLFNIFNLPGDVFEVVFSTHQQEMVARLLVQEIRKKGAMSKSEMSLFAKEMHEGKISGVSYNRRQFYDRILTPMKTMGLIDYDLYSKKYKLSEKFKEAMTQIGTLWENELKTHADAAP
ncbi:MAG: hypothetical protein GY861_12290 [bacterium]|nr:hypothetical protein [bacterium]